MEKKESQKYYSEKILYMPNSFMCFDDTRKFSNKCFKRKEFNLPDDAFVMAAFHKNQKITKLNKEKEEVIKYK